MPEVELLDVLAVPYPFVERLEVRQRPAVVLAKPPSKNRHPLLWVMMITSAINRRWPGHILISDLVAAGLPRPCLIRPAKVAVVENVAVERWGHLADVDAAEVRHAMQTLLQPLSAASP